MTRFDSGLRGFGQIRQQYEVQKHRWCIWHAMNDIDSVRLHGDFQTTSLRVTGSHAEQQQLTSDQVKTGLEVAQLSALNSKWQWLEWPEWPEWLKLVVQIM